MAKISATKIEKSEALRKTKRISSASLEEGEVGLLIIQVSEGSE